MKPKKQKREEAQKRLEAHQKLSLQEKLDKIARRFGSSKREHERLLRQAEEQQKKGGDK